MSYWSRIKENTSSLTSNLSSLSITNDSDGKEQHETMIHKAFINFYSENAGGRFPDWLIENDPTFQSLENNYNVQVTNMSSNSKFYPVQNNRNNYNNPQQQNTVPNQHAGQGAGRYKNSDLHDLYHNQQYHQQQQQQQPPPQNKGYQSARTHTAASASLQDMYKSSSRPTAGSSGPGNSNASSSLRDRFQRNNYSGFNRR